LIIPQIPPNNVCQGLNLDELQKEQAKRLRKKLKTAEKRIAVFLGTKKEIFSNS
jgi:hypothetical protein